VDNIAQVIRNGIGRVEPEIRNLRRLIGQVETASDEIAQNVSEEGIILRLLPETAVDSLTASSQSLRENFIAVYDLLEATSDILLALDKIPFVAIPERGLSTVATLQVSMEEIAGQVELLKSNIIDVRSEASARISQVTNAAVFLGTEADQFHADLIQIDTDLDSIQISVRKYQRLTRPVVLTSVIILSLLSIWIVYSQVVVISRSEQLILDTEVTMSLNIKHSHWMREMMIEHRCPAWSGRHKGCTKGRSATRTVAKIISWVRIQAYPGSLIRLILWQG
jgi:hypothetical protein